MNLISPKTVYYFEFHKEVLDCSARCWAAYYMASDKEGVVTACIVMTNPLTLIGLHFFNTNFPKRTKIQYICVYILYMTHNFYDGLINI